MSISISRLAKRAMGFTDEVKPLPSLPEPSLSKKSLSKKKVVPFTLTVQEEISYICDEETPVLDIVCGEEVVFIVHPRCDQNNTYRCARYFDSRKDAKFFIKYIQIIQKYQSLQKEDIKTDYIKETYYRDLL